MTDKVLIAGVGQVGTALLEVLSLAHTCFIRDTKDASTSPGNGEQFDFMHICFPYQNAEQFRIEVQKLQSTYDVAYTVVHSTVPIGTCRVLKATHSPVMGRHTSMTSDLLTFTKFIGGPDASSVAEHLRQAGMRVYITDKSETTEAMKLLCTLYYGVCIEFTKDVKRLCLEYGLPFELWSIWTDAYNAGVVARGEPELVRPNLVPILEPLGGHCVRPNLELLESIWCDFIRSRQ